MTKRFFLIAAVALLFTACAKDEVDVATPIQKDGPMRLTIGASFENKTTKSDFDDNGNFTWSYEDGIKVYSNTKYWSVLTIMDESASELGPKYDYANFTTPAFQGDYISTAAVFPQTVIPSYNDPTLSLKLPATIAWNDASLDDLANRTMQADNIMVARGFVDGANTLDFKNVGGLFRLTLNNVPVGATKVDFVTNKKINGTFEVGTVEENDVEFPVINTSDSYEEGENTVTITFPTLQVATKMVYFIPVPVGTYQIGFAVKDGEDNVLWEFHSTSNNSVARAHMVKMPTLSNITVGGGGEGATNIIVTPTSYSGTVYLPSTLNNIYVRMNQTDGTINLEYSSAANAQHPQKVYLQALGDITALNINLPDSHVELTGTDDNNVQVVTNVTASTSINTFVVDNKVQIGKTDNEETVGGLTINGGSLDLSAPVVGPVTVVYDVVSETVNKTSEKVSININSEIKDLVVTSASTQTAPDKIYVTLSSASKVNETLSVPETNCNLYIAPGAQAKTVTTSAAENTVAGKVENLAATGEGTTVFVTEEATVTKSIAASNGATVNVHPDAIKDNNVTQNEENNGTINSGKFVAAIGSKTYGTLAEAVAAAQSGETITILQDITTTESSQFSAITNTNYFGAVIEKSLTIDGQGHTITGPSNKRPFGIAGNNIDVTLKDLTIKNNGSDATIWACGPMTLTLDNTTVDGTNYKGSYNQPITIGTNAALSGRFTLNVVNGSVIKTSDEANAHYAIIVWNPSDITVSNSTLKGYAAVYVKPTATGSVIDISNSDVESHGYSGVSNAFGMFVTESNNNTFTLTSNNYSITAGDQYQVLTELNGTTGNVVKLLGTSTFTPNDAVHGTLVSNWDQYYVNSLYMDDANKETFANYISSECTVVKETSGDYNGLWKVTGPTPEAYYYWDTANGQQGTYCHLADPFDNGWLCDGEYIDVIKDITLTKTIACNLTSGSFRFNLAANTVTKGNYSITLKTGVSVVTDKATDIFTAADGNAIIVETKENGTYTYSAVAATVAIGTTNYATLAEAVAAVADGQTIKLLADVTYDDGIIYNKEGVSAKLNLNGKTLTVNTGSNANSRAIRIDNGTLEVYGGSIVAVGSGTTSSNGKGCYGAFRVEANGVLNAHDLNLTNSRPWGLNVKVLGGVAELTNVNITSSYGGGIEVTEADLGTGSKEGTATLTNCTFTQTGYFDHCSTTLSVSGGSHLEINGGTYTSDNYALYVFSSGGEIVVNNGTFSGNKDGVAIIAAIDSNSYPNYTGGLKIKGGNFSGGYSITLPAYMEITGGTFDHDPSAYVANGYKAVNNGNGTWTVKEFQGVAQIGTTTYATLEAAVAAAQNGDTITLVSDAVLEAALTINKDITLDLGTYSISGNVEDYLIQNQSALTITADAENPGKIYNVSTGKGHGAIRNETSGAITIYGGIFGDNDNDPTNTGVVNSGCALRNRGTAIINGGVFTTAEPAYSNGIWAYAIVSGESDVAANITFNGGHIYGKHGDLCNNHGTMVVNDVNTYGTAEYYSVYAWKDGTTTVKGGNFINNYHNYAKTTVLFYASEEDARIEVTGGNFTKGTNGNLASGNGTVIVSGGTFNKQPEAGIIAAGYEAVQSGDKWNVVELQGVAKIGSNYYASLAEAIAAANETTDATITLLSDVTESTTWTATKSMTLDLNGYTYTNTATANIPASYTGHSSYKASMMFAPAGNATFKVDATKGGKIVVNPVVKDAIGFCISDNINGSTAAYSDNNIQFVVKGKNSSSSVFEFSDNAKYGILAYYRNPSSAIVADNAKIVSTRTTKGGVTVYLEAIGNVNMENVCIVSSGPECICVGDSMKDEGDNNAKGSFTNCSFSQTGTNGENWQKVAINVSSNALVNVYGGSYSGVGGSISVASSGGTVKLYSGTFHGTNNRFVTTGIGNNYSSWAKTAIYYKEACTFTGATTDETKSGDIIASF